MKLQPILLASVVSGSATTVYYTVTTTISVSADTSSSYMPTITKTQYKMSNFTQEEYYTNSTQVESMLSSLDFYRSILSSTQPQQLPRFKVDFDVNGQLIIGVEEATTNVWHSGATYTSVTVGTDMASTSATPLSIPVMLALTLPILSVPTMIPSLSLPSALLLPRSIVLSRPSSVTTYALPQITHQLPDMTLFKRNYTLQMLSCAPSELAYLWLLVVLFLLLCAL